LRKYLIVALAAVLSIAVAAIAVAQSAPTLTTKVTPTKAGKKSKPKGATFTLDAKTNRNDATASSIIITLPKNVRLSGKGFPTCTATQINDGAGAASCPAASKIKAPAGKQYPSSAEAVYGPAKTPTTFNIDVYVGGKNSLTFHVQGLVTKAINAPITGGKSGQKLTINIPPDLQQIGPLNAGLTRIQATLKAKRGKNNLVSTIGCASRKHRTGLKFVFNPNVQYPATGSSSASDTSACKKK